AEAAAAELLLAVDHGDETFGRLEPAAALDLVHDGGLGERHGVDATGLEGVEEVGGLRVALDLVVRNAGVERVALLDGTAEHTERGVCVDERLERLDVLRVARLD